MELAQQYNKTIIPQLPRIINDEEIKETVEILESLPLQTVMLGEYGMLEALRIQDTT